MTHLRNNNFEHLRNKAFELGFSSFAVAGIQLPDRYAAKYRAWLDGHYNGTMDYLNTHLPLKENPRLLVENAMNVICVSFLYRCEDPLPNDPDHGYFSLYARGRDYHKVIKQKLNRLAEEIQTIATDCSLRVFVDSGPVFEKYYAHEAGLGGTGRNSLVISNTCGSFIFLGEIITNLPLPITGKTDFDPCKSCERCISICPTGAIMDNRHLNANLCIAYLTIEYKGIIPHALAARMGNHVYGCDECQLCCPWNRKKRYSQEPDFKCRYTADFTKLENLLKLGESDFLRTFEGSPIRRIGYESFLRNTIIAAGNSANTQYLPVLEDIATRTQSETVRQHTLWAMEDLNRNKTKVCSQTDK